MKKNETMTNLEVIYRKIIDRYGAEHQMRKAVEEMGELTAALMQHLGGRDNRDNVIEEIADVKIMIGQMEALFGELAVNAVVEYKLERMGYDTKASEQMDIEHDNLIIRQASEPGPMTAEQRDYYISMCRQEFTRKMINDLYRLKRNEYIGE